MLRQLPELLVTPYSAIVILPAVQQIHAQTLLKSHEPTLISPHHPQQETRDEEHTNLEKGNFKIGMFLIPCFLLRVVGTNEGRFVRFQQSLCMDLLDSREDYDGRVRRYKQFRKLPKHTSSIYSKTRTCPVIRTKLRDLEIYVQFMRNG